MSLSVEPVPVLVTDDPRIDLDPHPYYLVERGASDIIYQNYQSDSFGGGTINITTQISDRRTVVSSKIFIRPVFQVEVTTSADVFDAATAAASNLSTQLAKINLNPRFSPLMSSVTNCGISLNGKMLNEPIGRYFAPLMKYCVPTETAAYDFSTFPSAQDVLAEPYDFDNTPANAIQPNSSSNLSAVGNGGDDSNAYQPPKRSGWLANVGEITDAVTARSLKFKYATEEILPLSPLIWGHKEVKGIAGIDTLNVYINYDSQLLDSSIMYCPLNNNPLTTITVKVSLIGCSAEFIYFSPRANVEVPPVLRYRYNNIQHIPKNIDASNIDPSPFHNPDSQAAAKSAIKTFYSDSITLQGMPKRMYVFIKRQQSSITSYTPDTYARIDKISLQIGNRSGILSEAEPQVLYRMAVKNGYQGSWDSWYNNCGSVICIDFAQDIPLGLLEAPGTLSKLNLQYNVQGENLYYDRNPADFRTYVKPNLELNTVLVYEGMLIIKEGQIMIEQSVVSPLDVANSHKIHHVHYDSLLDFSGGSYQGGNISKYLSSVKKGFNKVKELANKAAPYIEKYGPTVVSAASKAIPILTGLLAAGYTENEIYNMMEKGGATKKGGARMTKKSLKARAITAK